eukprot:TRINITY_DN27828_c0_g1_i1.p1 TRINITY_DN27828_c0_g1~~TRINITY_DN27828_c0_g1_i1.p1  ORF type:complete len:386 (+),score=84.59 TRINITY_DN27828_c0_g1_i1:53-1159(+)
MGARFKNIFELHDEQNGLPEEEKAALDRVWALRCFDAPTDTDGCRDRIQEMFQGVERPVEQVENQRVLMVSSKYLSEPSYFNEVRMKYQQVKSRKKEGGRRNITCKVPSDSCDFCRLETNTSSDTFIPTKRISRETATTCSNIAKYAPCHSCIIFKEHNPILVATLPCIEDLLSIANEWVSHACKTLPGQYPVVGWNCLAGASMEHAHAQIITLPDNTPWMNRLGPDQGAVISDFIVVAKQLGIATDVGGAVMFPVLSPTADSEMWVVGDSGGPVHEVVSFGDSVCQGVKAALDVILEVHSSSAFNVNIAVAKTPLWPSGGVTVARIIDRGNHLSISPQGFMEVFGNGIVGGVDPFTLHDRIQRVVLN